MKRGGNDAADALAIRAARPTPPHPTARAVAVTDSTPFRAGRHLAARDALDGLGSCPDSTRAVARSGSKGSAQPGDRYRRRWPISGAHAVLQAVRKGRPSAAAWAASLLQRRPFKLVAVALADKTARMAGVVRTCGDPCRGRPKARPA